jgi:hypothetical protein
MNKSLLKLSLLAVGLCGIIEVKAQNPTESNLEVLGARFTVDAPTSISGVKGFTYSSDPANTGSWGAPITAPIIHQEVAKAIDSQACGPVTGVSGKWALIYRGDCEFGAKALHAQQAGAIGVIIWNHTPNELVNMAAGSSGGSVTIPVVFVSKTDGAAMNAELNAGHQVFISIALWGYGHTHDLAIVNTSSTVPPYGAIPLNQFDGTDIPAYRGYTGAYVANTGTSAETNVVVKSTINFTPVGGSASQVYADSVTLASFPVADSIHYNLFSPNTYKFTPTSLGTYTQNFNVYAAATDDYNVDNSESYTMAITANSFSKTKLDPVTQAPISSSYLKLSTANTPLTWGPLFYIHKGSYRMESVLYSVADDDTTKHDLTNVNSGLVDVYVFKWVDGSNSNPSDGFMQSGELALKGIAVKQFTTLDSNRQVIKSFVGDAVTGAPAHIVTEDNSYYWVAVNLGPVLRLGAAQDMNYRNRSVAAQNYATNKVKDFWGPAIYTDAASFQATDTIRSIPFTTIPVNSTTIDSSTFTGLKGAVPAVALITSVFPDKVENPVVASGDKFTVYPNPATDKITAKVDLLNKTSKLHIKVLDGFGRQIYAETLENVQQKEVTISTSGFASGNYYMIMISDNNALSRTFTVIAK